MATQRYISTSFWDDEWIQTLDPSEKLLYLYLMTNPLTNIAGVYKITIKRICFDTGFNSDTVGHILTKLKKAEKAYIYKEFIIIPSWPKHQKWEKRDSIKKGIDKELNELPEDVLDFVWSIGYQYPRTSGVEPPKSPPSTPQEPSYLDSDSDIDSDIDSDLDIDKDVMNPEAKRLAMLLFTLHRDRIDQKYKVGQNRIDSWSKDIDKIKRIDGREWQDIEKAIQWVKTPGCFWAANILSGSKLRDKFPTIIVQMNQGSTSSKALKVNERTEQIDMQGV